VKQENNSDCIQIRLDLDEKDSLYKIFKTLKEKTGINANTEVLRYAIKKVFDIEIKKATI